MRKPKTTPPKKKAHFGKMPGRTLGDIVNVGEPEWLTTRGAFPSREQDVDQQRQTLRSRVK